jgi:hypothetical protein
MGRIVDRTKENLGHSDLAIVRFRRLMLKLAKDLAEGRPPTAASGGELYNKRPATILLPQDAAVEQGAAQMMQGGR